MIQAQIYREWGVAIVKGRAECLLALLECTVPNASPRSKVACGKSRDKLIERANVAHCSGGFAEAVLLRRRYAVMKTRHALAADESATRGVSPPARAGAPPTSPSTVTSTGIPPPPTGYAIPALRQI